MSISILELIEDRNSPFEDVLLLDDGNTAWYSNYDPTQNHPYINLYCWEDGAGVCIHNGLCYNKVPSQDYFQYGYNSGGCDNVDFDATGINSNYFPSDQGEVPTSYISFVPNTLVFYSGRWMDCRRWTATTGHGISHKYYVNSEFDISEINSSEKVFYNPSHVTIDINHELVFPKNYTFKTAIKPDKDLFTYPSAQEIQTALAGLSQFDLNFNSVSDVPFHARQFSTYEINPGSSIKIEDCVHIYDVTFVNSSGTNGVIEFNSDNLIYRDVYPTPQSGGPLYVDRTQSMTCSERTNIPCAYTFEEDHEISTNETWTGKTYGFFKRLIVKNGATLTLDNTTLKFANSDATGFYSGIRIEAGGKLIVDNNSVLTSYLDCGYWDGIEVRGNNSAGQTVSSQGSIFTGNGSKISNAKKAIKTFGSSLRGGIVRVMDTDFENNLLDIELGYIPQASGSYIVLSTFSSNDLTSRFGIQKSNFIISLRHQNAQIAANYFSGDKVETGILNLGGEITVYNNQFVDLSMAVKAERTGGYNPSSIITSNTINISNYDGHGIWSDYGQDDQISENTIDIMSTTSFNFFGIRHSNGTGGSISYNDIDGGGGGGSNARGIVVNNGTNLDHLRNNNLVGVKIGMKLDGSGSDVRCNDFQNYVSGILVDVGRDWGDFGGPSEPVGNNFLDACVAGQYDVRFVGNYTSQKYYWKNGNPDYPNPSCTVPATGYLVKTTGAPGCSSGMGSGPQISYPSEPVVN